MKTSIDAGYDCKLSNTILSYRKNCLFTMTIIDVQANQQRLFVINGTTAQIWWLIGIVRKVFFSAQISFQFVELDPL